MKYKRFKALRKYCAMMAIACMLGMSACAGTQAVNGAWWDCDGPNAYHNVGCTDTLGGESTGNGSGCTG